MSSFSTVTRRQIIGSIGALVSGMAVARVMAAVIIILIARRIGPGAFGQYAASFAVAKLTSVLFTLGVDVWLLRNGNRAGDPGLLAKHSTSCLSTKAVLGVVWLMGMALVGPNLNQDVFPFAILMLAAVSVWMDEQSSTIWNSFKSGMRNQTASVLIVIAQSIFLGITLVLLFTGTNTLLPFVIGQVVASTLGTGIGYWQFRREIGISLDRGSAIIILREALPFALSMALALVYGRADITIIGHWLGETAVGLYSPAVSLIGALVLIPEASHTAMLPILSQLHSQNQRKMIQLSRWFVGVSILGGLVVAAGVIVVANPLVNFVYGDQFAASAQVLTILSGVLAARFVSFALGAIVVAVGWQNYRVIAQALSAGLNVGLNLLVVVSAGIVGVAKVYIVSEVVLMLGYFFLVLHWQRTEKRKPLSASTATSTPAT